MSPGLLKQRRRACATYKGVEISVLNAPIPDVSMSMDGKFHDIPFFGNDVVVRVRDNHVPNRNVHMIYLARKMIGLKKLKYGTEGSIFCFPDVARRISLFCLVELLA